MLALMEHLDATPRAVSSSGQTSSECSPCPRSARSPFGGRTAVKVSGRQTSGRFTVLETTSQPGDGMARHRHAYEEEWFHVVRGRFAFELDGRQVLLGPGGSLFAPRHATHGFTNVGDGPGVLLTVSSPAGLDELVRTTDELERELGPLETFMFLPLWEEYGLEMGSGQPVG